MADRVYPSAKPPPTSAPAAAPSPAPTPAPVRATATAPAFPVTKAQTYQRPLYRPQPPQKRTDSRRSCCYCFCIRSTIVIFAFIFIAALAAGIFYVFYHPQLPTFTISSFDLSQFNLSSSDDTLTSNLNLTVTARNPNSKIDFLYDQTSIDIATSDGAVPLGTGSFPAFVHEAKNTTILKATVTSNSAAVDSTAAAPLRRRSKLPMEIELDTGLGVKIGSLKTKKMPIKVNCDGFDVALPKKKAASTSTADVSCKVKPRIKIWRWTF